MRRLDDRRINAVLGAALALLVLGGAALGALVAYPALRDARARLAEASARAEGWERDRLGLRTPAAELERRGDALWRELLRRLAVAPDAPSLIARVAERVQAPSVRQLAVELRAREDAEAAFAAGAVAAPRGDVAVALGTAPVAVRFGASYADAFALLERIERQGLPARLAALEMKRDGARVLVRADLVWFTRGAPERVR